MPPRANSWGGERKRKMDDEMMDMLVTIVEEHPPFTLNQINTELRIRLSNKPHNGRTTLMKGLEARLLKLKKLEDAPEESSEVVLVIEKHRNPVEGHWLIDPNAPLIVRMNE